MKTNNILKVFAAATLCGAVLSSCTAKFEDYNTNKHEVTEDQLQQDNLAVGALFRQIQRNVIQFADGALLDSDYQIMYNLLADTYAGYCAPSGTFYNGKHTGSYTMIPGWCQAMFRYKFSKTMSAYQTIKENANGNEPVLALADILKVASMHQVTDYYGPIPYTKVGESLNSEYDSQEVVYKAMLTELDEAIDILENFYLAGNATLLDDYDYVYGGNLASWIKFANTLRLRLAMRIVYAEPALARTEAEKSVASGVMEEASDYARIQHSLITYHHPIYEINVNFNNGDCQAAASLESFLVGYGDPRASVYMKTAADGQYHGVRQGVQTSVWNDYRNGAGKVSAPNIDFAGTELVWMYASEAYFLRAEGALRGWNMGGTAKDLYEAGIETSFKERGVSGADTYKADNTKTPADYSDPVGSNNIAAQTSVTVAWNEAANTEVKLEKIITQKWISMYPNGCEAWAEYRRTGYPALLPPVNNDDAQHISGTIRRVPFPESEYQDNEAEVSKAFSLLNGGDNAGTKLWWDKK